MPGCRGAGVPFLIRPGLQHRQVSACRRCCTPGDIPTAVASVPSLAIPGARGSGVAQGASPALGVSGAPGKDMAVTTGLPEHVSLCNEPRAWSAVAFVRGGTSSPSLRRSLRVAGALRLPVLLVRPVHQQRGCGYFAVLGCQMRVVRCLHWTCKQNQRWKEKLWRRRE